MSFLLFLASAAFIGWMIHHTVKGTVPQFVHKFYYSQRNFNEKTDQDKATPMAGFSAVLLILFCLSSWFLLDPVFPDSTDWVRNDDGAASNFIGAWFILVLLLIVFVGRNFSKNFTHYSVTVKKREKEDEIKKAYGSKNWASEGEITARLPVFHRENDPDHAIGIHIGEGWHWYEKGHMLTVGGSGQGKGVNLVLPALLSEGFWRGGISVVCLDPKGENAAVAAPFLKKVGYDVHVLNPFGIPEIENLGNSRFNPFDQIDPDSNDASKLYDVLAMALHNRRGQGDSSFFDNRCRQYISLYLHYAHHTNNASWDTVYKWLTLAGEKRKTLLASMATDDTFEGTNTAEAISDRLTSEAAKTEESIYATIEEAVNVLKNKNLRASLAASDFDMRTVAKRPTAIFICVPFEDLGDYAAWVRMFFSFLLRTLTRYYNPDRKVLVLLDEFPQLSYMDEVPRSSAVLRGYNVTLWPIVQNLGQLKSIYGENWETFIGSAVIKHWLSAGADNTTADYIAKRMPEAIRIIGENPDGSPKVIERTLLSSNEVMGFSNIICEISGLETPAKFKKTPYWELSFAKENAAPNPFYN